MLRSRRALLEPQAVLSLVVRVRARVRARPRPRARARFSYP